MATGIGALMRVTGCKWCPVGNFDFGIESHGPSRVPRITVSHSDVIVGELDTFDVVVQTINIFNSAGELIGQHTGKITDIFDVYGEIRQWKKTIFENVLIGEGAYNQYSFPVYPVSRWGLFSGIYFFYGNSWDEYSITNIEQYSEILAADIDAGTAGERAIINARVEADVYEVIITRYFFKIINVLLNAECKFEVIGKRYGENDPVEVLLVIDMN